MSDWLNHDGGPCPVDRQSRPGVILRSGKRYEPGQHSAEHWDWWSTGHDADIISYKPEPQP